MLKKATLKRFAAYQYINSATHPVINIVIPEYDSPVVQQPLHKFGNQADKPNPIFFSLWRKFAEEVGQAREELGEKIFWTFLSQNITKRSSHITNINHFARSETIQQI